MKARPAVPSQHGAHDEAGQLLDLFRDDLALQRARHHGDGLAREPGLDAVDRQQLVAGGLVQGRTQHPVREVVGPVAHEAPEPAHHLEAQHLQALGAEDGLRAHERGRREIGRRRGVLVEEAGFEEQAPLLGRNRRGAVERLEIRQGPTGPCS